MDNSDMSIALRDRLNKSMIHRHLHAIDRRVTVWIATFYALSAVVCFLCLAGCVFLARTVVHDTESPRRELRSQASRIRSLQESFDELREVVETVANSHKMQRVRRATTHAAAVGSEIDPFKNPDEWRTMMNKRLAEAKIAGGKL